MGDIVTSNISSTITVLVLSIVSSEMESRCRMGVRWAVAMKLIRSMFVDSKIMPALPVSGLEFWKEVFVRNCSSTMNTN